MLSIIKKLYNDVLYRNSISIILNTVFNSAFGFIFWIAAARTMTAGDIGLAAAILSISSSIIVFSRLGLDIALVRFMPGSENKAGLYYTIQAISAAIVVLMGVAFLLSIDVISPSLTFLKNGMYAAMLIVFLLLSSLFNIQNIMFIALRKAHWSLVQNLALGMRIPLLLLLPIGFTGLFTSLNVSYLFTFLFGALVLYGLGFGVKMIDPGTLKGGIKYSFFNYTAIILGIIPQTILPLMIVNMLGAEENAYFFIPYTIATIFYVIPDAISTSLFVEGSHEKPLKDLVMKSLLFSFALLAPAIAIVFAFGGDLLSIFSKAYTGESLIILQLLSLASLFYIFPSVYISIKKIQKKVMAINLINLLYTAALIILAYVSLKAYGIKGIGYSYVIVYIFLTVLTIASAALIDRWGSLLQARRIAIGNMTINQILNSIRWK